MATVNFGVLILQFVTNSIDTEYIAAYSGASKLGYIYTSHNFGVCRGGNTLCVSRNSCKKLGIYQHSAYRHPHTVLFGDVFHCGISVGDEKGGASSTAFAIRRLLGG